MIDRRAFTIESRLEGDLLHISLVGEFCDRDVPAVARAIGEGYRVHARALLLDLGSLTFMDTSALAALLQADARCRRDGIAMRLSPPPPAIARLFETTGASGLLDFERAEPVREGG